MNVSFDLLLVTAVASEFKALQDAAREFGLSWTKQRGVVAEYRRLGTIQGTRVGALRLGAMGSFSTLGSAFTCYQALRETGATCILGVGIAFGVDPNTQRIGDIILSEALHLYDEGTVVDDAQGYRYTYDGPAVVPATDRLVDQFRRVDRATLTWPTTTPQLHVGRFLSGGARIESAAFRDHLVERVAPYGPQVVGGEMEAAGIAAACAAVKSAWVVVKAISDFATKESRAGIKTTRGPAADNAARFTLHALNYTPP